MGQVINRLGGTRNAVGIGVLVAYTVLTVIAAESLSSLLEFTVLGIAAGALFAISAAGLVLTYTTTGVFNFAHGAVGMLAAFGYYWVRVELGWPTPIAMFVVIGVIGPLVGLLLERVMRSFKGSPPATTVTVTVALTILLIGVVQFAFPAGEARRVPSFFGIERDVDVFGVTLLWDQLLVMAVAIAVAAALRYLLFVSRTGVAMRAVVDNPDLAALNGTRPVVVARTSWVLGSVLAALAGVLLAPQQGALEPAVVAFAVIAAFGAAVAGRLTSLPWAFAGALALGVLDKWTSNILVPFTTDVGTGEGLEIAILPWSAIPGAPWDSVYLGLSDLASALPALFLTTALLFQPEQRLRVGRLVTAAEPRVTPFVRSVLGGAAFVAIALAVANLMPETYLPDTARALVYGVLLLSLVLLTGFSGQISLAQYAFLGLGAWAMGSVGTGDTVLGLLAGAAVAIPIGVVVALPALRLQGLYLALSTFAIAVASRQLIFDNEAIFGTGNKVVGRPSVLGIDFTGNRAFIVLCAIVFALVAIGVLAVRRSAYGRRLAAMRDSPAACATLGLDIRRTKLIVFCGSSAIAGLAGGLFGALNSTVGTIDFEPVNNVVLFLFAVVGGITTVAGAFVGGALFALLPLVQSESPDLAGLVFAIVAATAVALGKQPHGLAGFVYKAWDDLRSIRRRDDPRGPGAAADRTDSPPVAHDEEVEPDALVSA